MHHGAEIQISRLYRTTLYSWHTLPPTCSARGETYFLHTYTHTTYLHMMGGTFVDSIVCPRSV